MLAEGQDFADKRQRGAPITVRTARTFTINYYSGVDASHSEFAATDTTPVIAKSGEEDKQWETIRNRRPSIWRDAKLDKAGSEFSALVRAQRESFKGVKGNVDFQEKAMNHAVLSAWAYVAGFLSSNDKRLLRHHELKLSKGKDPLRASALAKGRHKSDSENYRGLGYRTDAKERGRFVELFYAQAEKGDGITQPLINVAIAKYHAKQAMLTFKQAETLGSDSMAEIDAFAARLWEEAKGFLEKARATSVVKRREAYLHAALNLGFCSLEAHLNAIAEDFLTREDLLPHERSVLLEKRVDLEHGVFRLSNVIRFIA